MNEILEEIYKVREEIARAHDFDIDKISRAAARREQRRGVKLVTPSGLAKFRAAMAAAEQAKAKPAKKGIARRAEASKRRPAILPGNRTR